VLQGKDIQERKDNQEHLSRELQDGAGVNLRWLFLQDMQEFGCEFILQGGPCTKELFLIERMVIW